MNAYEIKQEDKRQRLLQRAEKVRMQGQGRIARAEQIASFIPMGQPILVGHHSEGRHRSDLKKISSGFEKGFEALKEAKALEARAENLGQNGISSDNPEAISLLQEKLAKLEKLQVFMVAANKVVRAFHKAGVRDESAGDAWDNYLLKLRECGEKGIGIAAAKSLLAPDFCGRIGFAAYQLSNNSAEISRCKARIAQLAAKAQEVSKEVEVAGGVKMVENVEDNRLQLIFPGKPSPEVIAELKGRGFRWAPSVGAWQRQLNNAARWGAECVLKKVAA